MFRARLFAVFLVTIFLMALVSCPLIAVHFIFCLIKVVKAPSPGYSLNVFLAYDQAINAICGPILNRLFCWPVFPFGYPDETISSVIGKNLLLAPEHSCRAMRIVDTWLSRIDPSSDRHCIDAIEYDEGQIPGEK